MMTQEIGYTKLPDRGLLRISGPDRRAFLQGLVSNDVNLLDRQPCVYACFLTPQGKFLHDMFISEVNETLLLDIEGGARAQDLCHRLEVYRLRSDVMLELVPETTVYAIFTENKTSGVADPRHTGMGHRAFERPDLPAISFETWDRQRISLGIPDGSRDMVPLKSTLLESNVDRLNGVSWKKGCYLGQELTARMHYRGLAKKHLYPVHLAEQAGWQPGDTITLGDRAVGEMRSRCGDVGLALLKDEAVGTMREPDKTGLIRV